MLAQSHHANVTVRGEAFPMIETLDRGRRDSASFHAADEFAAGAE